MANVLTYKSGAAKEMSPGQVITIGENLSFDTVTERWYYGNGVLPEHVAGSGSSPSGMTGGTWICMGTSDIERLPGAQIATVTWRGLKSATNGVAVTETRGIRETSYAEFEGIPGTSGLVPARILDQTVGVSVRAISRTSGNYKPKVVTGIGGEVAGTLPAGISSPVTPKLLTTYGPDPVWTYPYGWICYSWQEEEAIPGFYLVSAEYRYEHPKAFG